MKCSLVSTHCHLVVTAFITKTVLGILTDFDELYVCSCFRGRDRAHRGHLQPKTRLHTPNKVIKVIILIFLIPLPPDMLIEKPVGIRQKRARVNDGRGERQCGGDASNIDRKTCLTSQFGITKGTSSESLTKRVYNYITVLDAQNMANLNIKWDIPLNT